MDGGYGAWALEEAIATSFGATWRTYPLPGAADSRKAILDRGSGWRALRYAFPNLVTAAGLDAGDSPSLVAPVLRLLAPKDVEIAPLEPRARSLAAAMASVRSRWTAPATAALDAVLSMVATGDPAFSLAHDQHQISAAELVQRWNEANSMLASLLADRFAEIAQTLVSWYGAGTIGAIASGVDLRDLRTILPDHYLDPAAFYIRWQQARTCQCLPGGCDPDNTPKHHLHVWQPGRAGEAGDLSTWLRTWVAGQRTNGALPAKAFEAGIFYRHFLPRRPDTSIDIVVGDVLPEVCTVSKCAAFGQRAHRITSADPGWATRPNERVCASAEDHELDFAYGPNRPRRREMVLVGQRSTHRRYEHLSWDNEVQRWYFQDRRGRTEWLPIPHGAAFRRLRSRGAHVAGWVVPEVPYHRGERHRDRAGRSAPFGEAVGPSASSLPASTLPASPSDDLLSDETIAIIDDVLENPVRTQGLFVDCVAALRPTGRIELGPACRGCRCDPPSDGVRDFCDAALEEVMDLYLEYRARRGRER